MTLVVADAVTPELKALRNKLPHALLLSGERGVGLATIARELAGDDLELLLSPQAKDGTASENGTISVEMIRQLYEQTRSVSRGRQIIIIDGADRLSPGAGNALLKLLEEPPASTYFILTTHAEDTLLPTIRSRVQTLRIPLVSVEQSQAILASETDSTKRRQLEFMATGRPAELMRLIQDEEYFTMESERFSKARQYMSANRYQKLLVISGIPNQSEALKFCDALLMIAGSLLRSKPDTKLVSQLERTLAAREKIAANGNVKLNLLRSMV